MARILSVLVAVLFVLSACKKDKVPVPVVEEPTLWEQAEGLYKVYDTMGNYIYDMQIDHWQLTNDFGVLVDSLLFTNFDSSFVFSTQQGVHSNPFVLDISAPEPIEDQYGSSWQCYGISPDEKDNSLINDTLWLRFKRNNLAYYISDLVPYYSCECWQIAVKQ